MADPGQAWRPWRSVAAQPGWHDYLVAAACAERDGRGRGPCLPSAHQVGRGQLRHSPRGDHQVGVSPKRHTATRVGGTDPQPPSTCLERPPETAAILRTSARSAWASVTSRRQWRPGSPPAAADAHRSGICLQARRHPDAGWSRRCEGSGVRPALSETWGRGRRPEPRPGPGGSPTPTPGPGRGP